MMPKVGEIWRFCNSKNWRIHKIDSKWATLESPDTGEFVQQYNTRYFETPGLWKHTKHSIIDKEVKDLLS